MPNYDLQRQYDRERMRMNAQTAHEHHILEFQQLCALMIVQAIPEIKSQVKEEILLELQSREKQQERVVEKQPKEKPPKVEVQVDTRSIVEQIRNAIKKAFS